MKQYCRTLYHMQYERVLFHYNGHGVPKPTQNGEIWVFNKVELRFICAFFSFISMAL